MDPVARAGCMSCIASRRPSQTIFSYRYACGSTQRQPPLRYLCLAITKPGPPSFHVCYRTVDTLFSSRRLPSLVRPSIRDQPTRREHGNKSRSSRGLTEMPPAVSLLKEQKPSLGGGRTGSSSRAPPPAATAGDVGETGRGGRPPSGPHRLFVGRASDLESRSFHRQPNLSPPPAGRQRARDPPSVPRPQDASAPRGGWQTATASPSGAVRAGRRDSRRPSRPPCCPMGWT